MEKTNCKTIALAKGQMDVYDFGAARLHAYKTNDLISDECFLVEKGGKAFLIEPPCFFDNIAELEKYIADLGVEYVGTVVAYHAAGASFMRGKSVFSTKNADGYNHSGGGAGLVGSFAGMFGGAFDKSIHATTDFIEGGSLSLAGVEMKIALSQDAFDIEIPEIGAAYIHMLGHDVHSIVAGSGHADALIAQLDDFIARKFDLILTSHYTVENLEDAKAKIAYLSDLKNIAAKNADAAAFKSAVQKKYARYSGLNYLDMTAGMFYRK